MYEGLEMLLNGNIIGAAFFPYTNLLGNMIYAMILFFTMALIYFKTQNFGTVGIVGLIVSMLIFATPLLADSPVTESFAPYRFISLIFMVLSVTIVFYKVVKG